MHPRSIPLVLYFLCCCSTRLAAAPSPLRDPRIRTSQPALQRTLDEGAAQSPTFSTLVRDIDASDLVVYIDFESHMPSVIGGRTSLLASGSGRRYLRVDLCRRLTPFQLIVMLSHELQHVREIAQAPAVVDTRSLELLYRTIGTVAHACNRCYETAAAVAISRQVGHELSRYRRDSLRTRDRMQRLE